MKSDFENSKAYHYLDDLRIQTDSWFLSMSSKTPTWRSLSNEVRFWKFQSQSLSRWPQEPNCMVPDIPDSCPCHQRLSPIELGQIKLDFENSKAYHYLDDLRTQTEWFLRFLTPVHVIKDSNLENLVKSSQILKIPKSIAIYMTSLYSWLLDGALGSYPPRHTEILCTCL